MMNRIKKALKVEKQDPKQTQISLGEKPLNAKRVRGLGTSPIMMAIKGFFLNIVHFFMRLVGRPMSKSDYRSRYLEIYRPEVCDQQDAKDWLILNGNNDFNKGCYQEILEKIAYVPGKEIEITENHKVVSDITQNSWGANSIFWAEKVKSLQMLKASLLAKVNKVPHQRVLTWLTQEYQQHEPEHFETFQQKTSEQQRETLIEFYNNFLRAKLNVERTFSLRAAHMMGITFIRTGTLTAVDDALMVELRALQPDTAPSV